MSARAGLECDGLLLDPLAPAVMATIREHGYAAAEVDDFVLRAGVARVEFDLRFRDKDDAVRSIVAAHVALFMERVGGAFETTGIWPDNLRRAAHEAGRYLAENPDPTWFMTVGIFEADQTMRADRDRLVLWAGRMIDAGRVLAADPDQIPHAAAAVALGGFLETLRRAQASGRGLDLHEALPWLMYAAVRPYLGEEAATRELGVRLPPGLLDSSRARD